MSWGCSRVVVGSVGRALVAGPCGGWLVVVVAWKRVSGCVVPEGSDLVDCLAATGGGPARRGDRCRVLVPTAASSAYYVVDAPVAAVFNEIRSAIGRIASIPMLAAGRIIPALSLCRKIIATEAGMAKTQHRVSDSIGGKGAQSLRSRRVNRLGEMVTCLGQKGLGVAVSCFATRPRCNAYRPR